MSRKIFVFIDISGIQYLAGNLWIHDRHGVQRSSFRYDSGWLVFPHSFAIEPSLPPGEGTYHTDRPLFGCMGDAAPDRWGRMLMERMEARNAREIGTITKTWKNEAFLLGAGKREIDFMASAFEHENLRLVL